jgi:hypothetical protein
MMDEPTAQAAQGRRFARTRSWVQEKSAWLDQRDGLGLQRQLKVLGIVALTLILRRPSLFYQPQFYAEDGVYWYQQACSMGWLHSLTLPVVGYLCSVQRLATGLSLLVPFRWARGRSGR